MEQVVNFSKALSDTSRLRALMALSEGELCVCQLVELLALAPSTVSKHMSILKQAGLVKTRKDSRWVYYQLADTEKKTPVGRYCDLLRDILKEDQTILNDISRLKKIRKQDLESLCRHQKG